MKKSFALWLAAGAIILGALALWAFGGRLLGNAHEAIAAFVSLGVVGFAVLA